ncbi:NACHT domain-containing protein [Lentzea sp. NPDC058436]|uniref:NACHT domain-containing protein n=1 Tax=Lentzea sp. NPDC058436 TaxID=3346499 RepID=UPI00365A6878
MGLEIQAVSKLGQSVAMRAATEWLATNTDDRTASLAEIAAAELSRPTQRAKLDTLIHHIGLQVTEQLESALERFSDNDIAASLTAVEVALSSVDLSDAALLADNADPEGLAQRVRRSLPRQDLGRCYEIALDQSCRYLVQIIRNLPSFQPRALAEVLSRATAQAAMLDEVLSRLPRTSLYAPQGTDNDDEFRDEYLRFIQTNLDKLELLGLTMRDRPRLALSVAYLSLTVSGEKHRRDNWFAEPDHHAYSGMRVESALVRRTYIRGEAGSGKTTLLDWLAVTAARNGFTGRLHRWNGMVPFPIRLRSYADKPLPTKPEDFVTGWLAGIMPAGWAHRVLRAGKGLLLVDGVDEVPPEKRPEVREWLRELLQAFPEARAVVTARPAATDEKWLAELNFSVLSLEQMSPGDVKAFLQRWHEAADAPEEAQRRLVTQIESRQHLQGLASSPLLCAMLCALNLGRVSDLPHNRMELYAAALTMLLDLRDAERGIARILTTSDKTVLLRDLAWRLTLGGLSQLPTTKVHEHVARKIRSMPNVDEHPDAVVAHLLERSGVLREPVPGQVDFVHRTFQEYLAGEEAMQDGQVETLVAHADQDSWTQTIVLACGHGHRSQVTELLTALLDLADRQPEDARRFHLLAAACLETVRDVDADLCDRIDAIVRDRLVPPRTPEETASLATIGHRVLRYLPATLDELSDAVAASTIRTAALVASPEAMMKLAGYAHDPRSSVQKALIEAWLNFDLQRYAEEVLADAPLENGLAEVKSIQQFPHLHLLSKLTGVDAWLPPDESLGSLHVVDELPRLRYLLAWMKGEIDLSPLSRTSPEMIHLLGAQRYTNLESLPDARSIGLIQWEPWESLEFLRGKSIRSLHLSETAPGCTLGVLTEVAGLEAVYCRNWTDPTVFAAIPALRTLALSGDKLIDVRPVRHMSLTLLLHRKSTYVGVEKLGPDVRTRWES